ncbi:MAG: cytochrome c [Candidimonas sp.]|nr:MAG: cytochrome c [Candidimonas sp.]TAM21905.1 MAG: cytochrome c [Candidimonas sp.]
MRIWMLALMLGLSTTAMAAEVTGDANAGAKKIAVCLACHGVDGRTPAAPIYPRLAGQSSEYLKNALHAYHDGQRQGGMSAMMSPQAAMLSDQDIADIAAYFSEQSPCVAGK